MIIPVVIAGGVGSRLWPVSRQLYPKQYIAFAGEQYSLFQQTLIRLRGLSNLADPIVVCNEEHRFLVAEQLRALDIQKSIILLEPVGKNTAPAVAMAAFSARQIDTDAVLLVLPADHVIQNQKALHEAIEVGHSLAEQDKLVTFGIVADAPETGFGYIRKGSEIPDCPAFNVDSFVEKPDLDTARQYLSSGNYFWNSGMFMFKATNYLTELDHFAAQIYRVCSECHENLHEESDYKHIPKDLFKDCESDSIDYAVMENTTEAVVIPLDAQWSDLGAWDALWEVGEKDQQNNVLSGDVLTDGVKDSYIHAQSRLVAAVGVENIVIVETSDAVLVAQKSKAQHVKQIVEQLKQQNRQERVAHDLVYRPWGSYQSLAERDGYKVKHIVVNPGASLSLQLHHHRAEHWTIVKGTAVVTCDDKEFTLKENESTFIPLGSKHRIKNPGETPVEFIEVQLGNYLGEDDIVRFEDIYGRASEKTQ